MRLLSFALFLASFLPGISSAQTDIDHGRTPARAWVYLDAPLWDLADEGLPFRLTLALPSRLDALSRSLLADRARWTLSAGYAKVYNSYDGATGVFKNPGGHAALFSAGRQMIWELPRWAGALTPDIALEYGIHYATTKFPADGTRANFKLITGLEWRGPVSTGAEGWTLGVYWPHFSNANLLSRNAGYDGLCVRIGRVFLF